MDSLVLKEITIVTKDGEWGKGEPFDSSVEMAVIRGTDFEDARVGLLDDVPSRHIPEHIATRKRLQAFDILIETAGGSKDRPTGRTLFVKPSLISKSPLPLTCASFARFIRIDQQKANPEYVFWLLQYLYNSGFILQYHTQHTGVARFQFTTFAERETLPLPPIAIQERVASILSAYDDLIENNTRRIKILEQMAQMLYREWFVNFRFPGHEKVRMVESELGPIPEGWRTFRFTDLLHSAGGGDWGSETTTEQERCAVKVIRGTDIPDLEAGSVDRTPKRFITPRSREKRLLKDGDIIVENSVNAKTRCSGNSLLVSTGMLRRLGSECIAASFCKTFRPRRAQLAPLLFLHLRRLHREGGMAYYQNVAANGIANFQATRFVETERIALPTDPRTLLLMTDALAALTSSNSASRIHNLRTTRDLLLPKLISGEITVEAADKAAAELAEQTA